MIRITAIHMSAGYDDLTHIERVKWQEDSTGKIGDTVREEVVEWIDNRGVEAYVLYNNRHTRVVTAVRGYTKYLKTTPNNTTRDNLLDLPRY